MPHSYRIFETKRFLTDLKSLAKNRSVMIEEKLQAYVYPQLKKEPHFGQNIKRLKDWVPPTWRYRVGDWRFFYIVDDDAKVVFIIAASHRKGAYR